ncbi:RNA-binding cell elongation regulator Jag/EloR [Candidatus Oleimmundimicrobium sp.]|uniref:RNA-binding cell elongation regulator Jag/EloR n=1 Tax=Candidatus Oleimmundimicrobium sp. TaxID=3060597 RepID=UPI00271D4857|nr:RNA-binding cell elongation regulator Jag/EloR [Candidatus Oleimmundimicrobium sp.]MDO8886387.1 RNA-binding cell elongation regulator Jag/EloR [Candidatus Oleimmundimicrobium sp.]
MDKIIEAEGETIEEAIKIALEELKASQDEVEIEVLRENSKGFLGLDKKRARVRVVIKDKKIKRGTELVEKILELFNLKASVSCAEIEGRIHLNIEGENLGILIGRNGSTLQALQLIIGVGVNKGEETRKPVVLDIEGYRLRTEKSLKSLANRLAELAVNERKIVSLRPMSAFERKIIHEALQDNPEVQTISEGERSERRVTIRPVDEEK